MIYSVRGKLIYKDMQFAVVECAGVGYGCRITFATYGELPDIDKEVFLYTYLHMIKDGDPELFGFADKQELHCFKLLLSVSGVGAATALSILSDLDAQRFALAVASEDSKLLSKTKGVGAKTAQRIVLELKDKIAKEGISRENIKAMGNVKVPVGDSSQEAVTALMALGFSNDEAMNAISQTDMTASPEEIIKNALKQLGKKR